MSMYGFRTRQSAIVGSTRCEVSTRIPCTSSTIVRAGQIAAAVVRVHEQCVVLNPSVRDCICMFVVKVLFERKKYVLLVVVVF